MNRFSSLSCSVITCGILAAAGSWILTSCTMNSELPEAGSSFALLQEKVLTPSCATSGCHDTRNAVGGLDLSPAMAYQNLVGAEPTNQNAKTDKLLRVKAGDPYKSFLYNKLDSANLHKSDGYGSPMPLGSRAVTAGQLDFIKFWIAAGAPKNGTVADAKLLEDNRPQNEVLTLAQPASGVQMRLSPFGIAPQNEREIYFAQANTQELIMTKFEMIQRDRSHHFILYGHAPTAGKTMPRTNVIRDLYLPNGQLIPERFPEMSGRTFIIASQLKAETIEFPPGMAMRIPANWLLDLNSHYTNGTRDTIRGEVLFNIHTTPASNVRTFVKPLQLGFFNLLLPPKKETVVETTFLVGGGGSGSGQDRFSSRDTLVNIIGLTSHTHRMGRRFVTQIVGGPRNGEVIYTATNWLNPPLLKFDTPIVLRRGEGLKSIVTYYNDTNETVTFGFRSTDEMNFIFGYFY
ncbi:MAG: hypothetical protein MUF71_04850 [Candidatus Kapabacteria bacterium]|nr:hypothetical protein [Candidatus Kapabacteria bacterium]